MSNRIAQLTDETAASVRAGQVVGSISRAVEELVRNAVEHGRCSTVVVTVGSSKLAHSNDLSCLQVHDDGTGIDAAPLRRYVGTEYCSSSSVSEKHRTAASGQRRGREKRRRDRRSESGAPREAQNHSSGAATSSQDASCRAPFSASLRPDGNEVTRRESSSSSDGETRGESLKALANLCVEMRISTKTRASPGCGGKRKYEDENTPWARSIQKETDSSAAASESLYCSKKVIRKGVAVEFSSAPSSRGSTSLLAPSRQQDDSLRRWRRKHERDTATNRDVASTGTTVSLEGLFYTHAVRKRHYHRERSTKNSDPSNKRHNDTTSGTYTGERADIGQIRACLRTLSLAYPSVSFYLENGRTRSSVASWPAYAPVPTPPSHSDRSVCQMGQDPKDVFRSILSRLRQVCGEALADVGDGGYTPISYVEAPSHLSRGANRGKRLPNASGAADRTRGTSRVKSHTRGDTSHKDLRSGIWKVVGIVCHQDVCGTNSSKHCQSIFVNGRAAQHASKLASVVQKEVISHSSPPSIENATVGVCFVLHISCPHEEADVVIEETRSTIAVTRRDYLEHIVRTSVAVAFQTRRNGKCDLGASCISEQKSAPRRTRRNANASSMFTAPRNRTRLISGKMVRSVEETSSPHFSTAPSASSVDEQTQPEQAPPDCTMVQDSSPFSNAFMGDEEATSAGVSFAASLGVTFEDAFCDKTQSDNSEEAQVEPATNGNDANDAMDESLRWTRTRLRALESQITSLMPSTTEATKGLSISITKEMLSSAGVIAQLDAKFIIINAGGLLCVVDQHAGDERIRLERLEARLEEETHGYRSSDGPASGATSEDETLLKSAVLVPAQPVRLSPTQLACVTQHEEILTRWRFTFAFPSKDGNTVLLNGVPCVCGKKATTNDFIQFIQALCSSTADASVVKPAFVKRVLASHACRYAIMFGDVLSHGKCVDLIRSLSKCDLSFVCAHGRPSVVPLLDMRGIGGDKVRPEASAPPFNTTSSFAGNKGTKSVPLRFRPSRVVRKQKI